MKVPWLGIGMVIYHIPTDQPVIYEFLAAKTREELHLAGGHPIQNNQVPLLPKCCFTLLVARMRLPSHTQSRDERDFF